MNTTSSQGELFDIDTPEAPEVTPSALTVKQPWAWAIMHAGKDVENRSRTTHYRGRLLIHAGKGWSKEGAQWLADRGIEVPDRADLPAGCIIGSVDVVGSTQTSTSEWAMEGHHHWELANPTHVQTTIPCRGSLSPFQPPAGWEQAFTPASEAGTGSCA